MSTLRIFLFWGYLKFVSTRRPHKLNEKLRFSVISKKPITGFFVTMVARGRILTNSYFPMMENPYNKTVKITVRFNMIPEATFYVQNFEGEEMRMDVMTFSFENDFSNSVCLRIFVNLYILYNKSVFIFSSYVSRFT